MEVVPDGAVPNSGGGFGAAGLRLGGIIGNGEDGGVRRDEATAICVGWGAPATKADVMD